MKITIKLFASLQQGRFDVKIFEIHKKMKADDIRKMLKIPKKEKLILLINGRHADLHNAIKDGDTISLFPLLGGG